MLFTNKVDKIKINTNILIGRGVEIYCISNKHNQSSHEIDSKSR